MVMRKEEEGGKKVLFRGVTQVGWEGCPKSRVSDGGKVGCRVICTGLFIVGPGPGGQECGRMVPTIDKVSESQEEKE